MNGMTITARISAAVKMPVPNGGPANRSPSTGMPSKRVDEEGLDVLRHERHDDEEAPHAVDDRGHGGEQFDGGADGAAQPGGRQFGQVEGDAERQRHREDHRQNRGDERAVNRNRGAEHLLHRVPVGRTRKPSPNCAEAPAGRRSAATGSGCQAAPARRRRRRQARAKIATADLRRRRRLRLSASWRRLACTCKVLQGDEDGWRAPAGLGTVAKLHMCPEPAFHAARTASFTLAGSGI